MCVVWCFLPCGVCTLVVVGAYHCWLVYVVCRWWPLLCLVLIGCGGVLWFVDVGCVSCVGYCFLLLYVDCVLLPCDVGCCCGGVLLATAVCCALRVVVAWCVVWRGACGVCVLLVVGVCRLALLLCSVMLWLQVFRIV